MIKKGVDRISSLPLELMQGCKDSKYMSTEAQIGEKEGEYIDKIKPDEKKANINFREGESLNITEILIQESDHPLKIDESPKEYKAKADLSPHSVAEKSEVIANIIAGEISAKEPISAEARFDQTPFEGIILNQPQIIEKEGDYKPGTKPDTKKALSSFV